MQLVFLSLEMREESTDTDEIVVAIHDRLVLLMGELKPRNIYGNPFLSRPSAKFGENGPIFWFGPRFNGAFGKGLRFIGDHEVHIEIDGVAESLAARTRAERIVEREEPRLGFFVADPAAAAFKAAREAEPARFFSLARRGFEDGLAGLAIAGLERVHDAGTRIRGDHDAIDERK